MTGGGRDRVGDLVDAALADDRPVGEIPEELRAQLDDELGEPPDIPTGCAVVFVLLLALLLVVAIVGGAIAAAVWWL